MSSIHSCKGFLGRRSSSPRTEKAGLAHHRRQMPFRGSKRVVRSLQG